MGAASVEKSMEILKKFKDTTTIWSSIYTSEYLSEEYRNTNSKKKMCNLIFITTLSTIAKIWLNVHMHACTHTHTHTHTHMGFPGGSVVKSPPANPGDSGWIPGSGRSPGGGHGNPFQYSWVGNSRDRRAWQATVHRVTKKLDTTQWLNNNTYRHNGIFGILLSQKKFAIWDNKKGPGVGDG